eukprot:3357100-Amphidinium_carterae.2
MDTRRARQPPAVRQPHRQLLRRSPGQRRPPAPMCNARSRVQCITWPWPRRSSTLYRRSSLAVAERNAGLSRQSTARPGVQ